MLIVEPFSGALHPQFQFHSCCFYHEKIQIIGEIVIGTKFFNKKLLGCLQVSAMNNFFWGLGRRRGLVVRAVDYGVGDPRFESRRGRRLLFNCLLYSIFIPSESTRKGTPARRDEKRRAREG